MKNLFLPFNFSVLKKELHHNIFNQISIASKQKQSPAFVIGGFVRDLLLGRPSKDVDVVCLGSGIELAKSVADSLKSKPKVSIFKTFGTAMFKAEGWEVEFVGARKESYSNESRKPSVEVGSLEDDQNRRDFTINALALSLNEENFGELIDPFNGMQDLKDRILRTPLEPGITYSDDPLRMMRAIRFATQLDFVIEENSLRAISAHKERIRIVSMERISDELNKIILAEQPSKGFKLLFDTGLLHIIFPEMADLQGVDTLDGKSHKDNFYHTLQVLDNISANTNDLWLRWAAILHDIAKPPTKRFDKKSGWTFHGHEDKGARMVPDIFRKLKLPLDSQMKYVQKLVRLHLRPISLVTETVTDSAVRRLLFEAGNDIEDLMTLCSADITTKNKNKQKRYLSNFELVQQKLKEVEEKDQLRNWQPPVSGESIMEIFSIPPSKNVGILKKSIREAILDGEIPNEKEAVMDFLLKAGKKLGLAPKKI